MPYLFNENKLKDSNIKIEIIKSQKTITFLKSNI